jgi:hypothetical protein
MDRKINDRQTDKHIRPICVDLGLYIKQWLAQTRKKIMYSFQQLLNIVLKVQAVNTIRS